MRQRHVQGAEVQVICDPREAGHGDLGLVDLRSLAGREWRARQKQHVIRTEALSEQRDILGSDGFCRPTILSRDGAALDDPAPDPRIHGEAMIHDHWFQRLKCIECHDVAAQALILRQRTREGNA